MERKVFYGEIPDNPAYAETHLHLKARNDDGKLTAEKIAKQREKQGIDVVCVTPHNDLELSFQVADFFEQRGMPDVIVPGKEITARYKTDRGETKDRHVLGLYLNSHIPRGMHPYDTVEEILKQDGIVILPHPGNGDVRVASMTYGEIEDLFKRFPEVRFGIEIYSAAIRDCGKLNILTRIRDSNREVLAFYLDHQDHLFPTGGSDAHFGVLGYGVTVFEGKNGTDLRHAMDQGRTSVEYIDRMQSRNPIDLGGHKAEEAWRKLNNFYGRVE